MSKIDNIVNYIRGIDLDGKNPLEFLIEDNIRTNPYHKYVIKKIISQLSVRDHINGMAPALKADYPKSIFRSDNIR